MHRDTANPTTTLQQRCSMTDTDRSELIDRLEAERDKHREKAQMLTEYLNALQFNALNPDNLDPEKVLD